MAITLSNEARQHIGLFEAETGATATDCVVEDDRVLVVVAAGEMGQAIGPDGRRIERVRERIDADVSLIEDADTPEAFVANALAPAAVYEVTVSGEDEPVAYAEVDEADKGAAIGRDGRNIEAARLLAERHFDIADVQLV